jgi:hypothetical protein
MQADRRFAVPRWGGNEIRTAGPLSRRKAEKIQKRTVSSNRLRSSNEALRTPGLIRQ